MKKTQKGEGVVTRVSPSGESYINVRLKTNDHKLVIDAKFTLKAWAEASTCLFSDCVIDISEKEVKVNEHSI